MPAKAGIQYGVDSLEARSLDAGFRRGDDSILIKALACAIPGRPRAASSTRPTDYSPLPRLQLPQVLQKLAQSDQFHIRLLSYLLGRAAAVVEKTFPALDS